MLKFFRSLDFLGFMDFQHKYCTHIYISCSDAIPDYCLLSILQKVSRTGLCIYRFYYFDDT